MSLSQSLLVPIATRLNFHLHWTGMEAELWSGAGWCVNSIACCCEMHRTARQVGTAGALLSISSARLYLYRRIESNLDLCSLLMRRVCRLLLSLRVRSWRASPASSAMSWPASIAFEQQQQQRPIFCAPTLLARSKNPPGSAHSGNSCAYTALLISGPGRAGPDCSCGADRGSLQLAADEGDARAAELVRQWSPDNRLTPADVSLADNSKVWWRCDG